jgi:hypothetical protein
VSTQQIPARAQRLYALWSRLPSDAMTEAKFHAAILAALDRGPGSEADASAFVFLLTSSEAVTVSRGDDGQPSYLRAPAFPDHPPNGPGTLAFDRQLADLAREEQEQHDRVAAEVEANAPINRQREQLDAHVRSVVRQELPRALREAVRAELPALMREQTQQAEAQGRLRGRAEGRRTQDATA